MICMVTLSGVSNEIEPIRQITKDLAARLSDEKWEISFFSTVRQCEKYLKEHLMIDFICYDVTVPGACERLADIRKGREDTGLLLITDESVSPIVYLKPGVRADSLLIRPLTKENVTDTLRVFFEEYLKRSEEKKGISYFPVEEKDGLVKLPYQDIFYFESREKKIFVRTLLEEYGFYGTLDQLQDRLPDEFARCHRGFIVNQKKIKKLMLSKNTILLTQGMEVPISRSYKTYFKGFGKEEWK